MMKHMRLFVFLKWDIGLSCVCGLQDLIDAERVVD